MPGDEAEAAGLLDRNVMKPVPPVPRPPTTTHPAPSNGQRFDPQTAALHGKPRY
jgi:hypothetical protein